MKMTRLQGPYEFYRPVRAVVNPSGSVPIPKETKKKTGTSPADFRLWIMEDAMKLSALILLIVFSGTFLMAAEHEEKIQKTFPLTSGGTVDLSNIDV